MEPARVMGTLQRAGMGTYAYTYIYTHICICVFVYIYICTGVSGALSSEICSLSFSSEALGFMGHVWVRGYGPGVGQTGDVCGAWIYVKAQILGFVEVGLYAKLQVVHRRTLQ